MNEEINIINTNKKNYKIKNFIINNKKKIIILLSTIILIFFGYFILEEIKQKKKLNLANIYNASIINFNENNTTNVKNEMIRIIKEKNTTYSPLALNFLIDNNISISDTEINELFNILINEANLEKEIKNLIIYKKALYNSDFESENNLLEILKPIINSESIWKSHALYLMAEYFYSKNEKIKAKEFFEDIIILENSNSIIKTKAQKRINRDFSE